MAGAHAALRERSFAPVAVAPPALMDALQSDTVPLAAGDGWHLETRPFLDSGVLALYYVDGEHEDRTGFVSLADGPPVLDVVADPFESRVSVSQNGRAVLDVANAAARGLKVDPLWNTLPGGSGSLCTSILDRMPAADGSGG